MEKIVKIEIITRQNKFELLKEALNKINVSGMTVTQVLGYGNQKGRTEVYRGTEYSVDLLPKIKVEVVVPESLIEPIVSETTKVCNTGHIGDGKIFIYPIDRVIRIRTQEEAGNAI
ncbi:P-II family nitrogen regulator [Serpentinicella alkaliphila]|uniref:Nitrogen regulatory protein P-II family n=1 Tax=Serpentinicella alkaliphila TaxID=1734049 RepID=A0A4R2TMG9_9FIRM|nr:P-II family nitrogen regulator [Serpentinicella alkaliphila]TCQ04671.1 nitrogen regulatory protein P-II family [Serpentinicella alkaliphila]